MDFKSKLKDGGKSDLSKGTNSREKEETENDYVYAPVTTSHQQPPVHHQDRTMFVVDLSRLKDERDTLENALVMYSPMKEFQKQQYEQRCSQLVGLALCTLNFTGKYPEFLRLKGTGYAIRGLGEHYIMGLSSRIEEPPAYCVQYLKTVHDMFRFYYHSPSVVLKTVNEDWDQFKELMTMRISNILDYILRDQHSVPAMLNPLPYLKNSTNKRNSSRNYLLASRILRACQNHTSIVAGALTHNKGLVISQFSPDITEKLLLIGGGAISLDRLSVLGDNIAPGKVWVLEVFLTVEEESLVRECLKDHSGLKTAYSSLDRVAHMTLSTMAQLQNVETIPVRSNTQWRWKISDSSVNGVSQPLQSTPRGGKPPPLQGVALTSRVDQFSTDGTQSPSKRSEDDVIISPNMSTVFYDNSTDQQRSSSSSSTKQDADESEYVDAVETIETSIDPDNGHTPKPCCSPSKPIPRKEDDSDVAFEDARPDSISSEVFATPSPSPPRDLSVSGGSKEASNDIGGGSKEVNDDTLTRDENGIDPASLTNEELTKLINTPVFLDPPEKDVKISTVSSTKTPAMALPPSWKLRATTDSEEEDDFVDSEVLEKMLQAAKKKPVSNNFVNTSDLQTMADNSNHGQNSSKFVSLARAPPLPPRNAIRSQPHPLINLFGESPDAPPPLPPRNCTPNRKQELLNEQNEEATSDSCRIGHSIYDTMRRDDSLNSPLSELTNGITDEESTPVPLITPDTEIDGDLVPSLSETALQDDSTDETSEEASTRKTSGEPEGHSIDIYDSINLSSNEDANTAQNGQSEEEDCVFKHVISNDDSSVPQSMTVSTSLTDTQGTTDSLNQTNQSLYLESSFEYIPDGMCTPPTEVSFRPESLANGLPLKFKQIRNRLRAPTLPPRSSPKPKGSKGSDEELSDSDNSSGDESLGEVPGARGWITATTLKRPQSTSDKDPYLMKRCIYVQQYMGTEVVLLARENLHKNHDVLNSLWRSLLHHLMELDNSLRKDYESPIHEPRPATSVAVYSGLDRSCEAVPFTTAYHFRHALRRVHQEYAKDPTLMQASLSKEHMRLLSQHVHKREVYLHPSQMGRLDVLAMHGAVEKYAKTKTSLRQQPTGGPKIMFV